MAGVHVLIYQAITICYLLNDAELNILVIIEFILPQSDIDISLFYLGGKLL